MTTATDFAGAKAMYEMAHGDLDDLGDGYSNEECDLLASAQSIAIDALMATPAPDFPALLYKMEIFAKEERFDITNAAELFAALIADVRRLAEEVQ